MPRKFLRRWIPNRDMFAKRRSLRFLKPLLDEPNLFHLNRHSVSMAFFIGIFTAFLPLPGQTIIGALLALLLRGNLPISQMLIWITNPITTPPLFYLTFELGRWILDTPPVNFHIQLTWEWFNQQGKTIIKPLLLGSLLSGFILGGISYLAMHQLWRWHVIRSWEFRKKQRLISPSFTRNVKHPLDECVPPATQDKE